MDSQLYEGSAFKEGLKQEFYRPFQNPMHHESNEGRVFYEASSFHESPFSPIQRKRVGDGFPPCYYDRNLSYRGFNNPSTIGCSMFRSNDRYNTYYSQQFSNSHWRGDSSLFAPNGKNSPSLVDPKRISEEVVSPEHKSSVTACSDAELYRDKEPLGLGATCDVMSFCEPTPGNSHWIKPNEFVVKNHKINHVLSSMVSSKPKEWLSQSAPQTFQSKPCHLEPCPPSAHFDGSLEGQMYGFNMGHQNFHNEVSGEMPSNLSRLTMEPIRRFQQQRFCNVQASKPTNSFHTVHRILFEYHKFRSKQPDFFRSQQAYVDHLHVVVCKGLACKCDKYSALVSHYDECQTIDCTLCVPARQLCQINSVPFYNACSIEKMTTGRGKSRGYVLGNFIVQETQPAPKRLKLENAVSRDDWSLGAVVLQHLNQQAGRLLNDEENIKEMNKELFSSKKGSTEGVTWNGDADNCGLETENVCFSKTDGLLGLGQSSEDLRNSATLNNTALSHSEEFMVCDSASKIKCDVTFSCQSLNSDGISVLPEEPTIDQGETTKLMSVAEHDRIDTKCDSANSDYQSCTKLEHMKGSGVSLTDFFTAEQIKEHLGSLKQCINLNIEKVLTGNETAQTAGANTCQLCPVDGLNFAGPPMYCSCCQVLIKHKINYYRTLDEMGTEYCFCTLCFSVSRGGNISIKGGLTFPKGKLYKAKNTTEFSEPWVQCDKCERWQHQICALYNSKQDLEGKVDYICPICRLAEIEAKEHVPVPPATGARDLPRTKLSDHIERRLLRSLEHERKQRAESLGKSPEEVPGAADLVVRVVLAVNKQLQVKQEFLDIIPGESYPTEFPYKSKVILLFQKVDGVDVCLFAMYVQEYGSECGNPNKRSVYISYLDSVKYFRPEVKTVAGVALRTIVYHEILIGYLDYCKQCGFTTCYIWACPPKNGEDYILYCHPETQKRPNTNKLSQWYKKMLKKAKEDNVVVESTNFYDHFFVPSGECNSKVTAARLPYFDGDYWSGAIEDMVRTTGNNSGGNAERKLKNSMTRRTLKAMGHSDLSSDTSKDILVMQKLGHTIQSVREDFFVVHLQFTCTNCHEAILSGSRWSCTQCRKFHLCSRCFELKQIPNGLETHKTCHGKKDQLCRIPVSGVAADTEDKDVLLYNDFLDNRHSFLDFCQKNDYQFDSLRRAKHSSMMILHDLHKMTALTTQTICSICHQKPVVGWHCEICSEFHVCNACYQKEGDRCHIHKLLQHFRKADCRKNSDQIQQQSASEGRTPLDVLEHANQCRATRDNPCTYPRCRDLKRLFLHSTKCERRYAGGCNYCKKMWSLLNLHSQSCTDSNCSIPRCMDIKKHKDTIPTESDLQRRAAAFKGQLGCKDAGLGQRARRNLTTHEAP